MIMFAEIYQDGQWRKVGKEFTSWWPELGEQLTDRVCDELNNFFLLSVLGKDIGFMREYNIAPINAQSGLPDDISAEVANALYGKRTFYIDFPNLFNYPWDKTICKEGYITEWQYRRLKDQNIAPVHIFKPKRLEDYDYKFISPYQMDVIIANPSLRQKGHYYIKHEYDHTTLREQCAFFCTHSMEKLLELALTSEVRILYSFGR